MCNEFVFGLHAVSSMAGLKTSDYGRRSPMCDTNGDEKNGLTVHTHLDGPRFNNWYALVTTYICIVGALTFDRYAQIGFLSAKRPGHYKFAA